MILKRLECQPPKIANSEIGKGLPILERLGFLRKAESATSLPCQECDGGTSLPIQFLRNRESGKSHAYISCPHCGLTEVELQQLDRWRIDPVAVLQAILRSISKAVRQPTEVFPGQLWNAGKIHLAGQLREVFFIAGYRSSSGSALTTYLRTHPKCIVLMPSEIGVSRLGTASENFVVAIESFAFLDGGNINVQRDVLEKRIAYFFGDSKPKTRPKRRESRLGDIEALELEFTEHLRAARDYAVTTRDLTGTAKLLKKPTRDEFAKRAGVSASSVTRCMADPAGWKLQRMWHLADDLDAIIGYRED